MNTEKFNEKIVKEYLNSYFLANSRRKLLARKYINDYIYKRKSKAAFTLMYKRNIYQANLTVVEKFMNEILSEKDKKLIKMRYKYRYTFVHISVCMEEGIANIYSRHRKILRTLYFVINAKVSFEEVYMLSPKLLSIMEERISREYSYALLGMELNEKNNLGLDPDYIFLLKNRKNNISCLKLIVIQYLNSLKENGKQTEYKIITTALEDMNITREETGKIFFLSPSRIVQILSNFKKRIKMIYDENKKIK